MEEFLAALGIIFIPLVIGFMGYAIGESDTLSDVKAQTPIVLDKQIYMCSPVEMTEK